MASHNLVMTCRVKDCRFATRNMELMETHVTLGHKASVGAFPGNLHCPVCRETFSTNLGSVMSEHIMFKHNECYAKEVPKNFQQQPLKNLKGSYASKVDNRQPRLRGDSQSSVTLKPSAGKVQPCRIKNCDKKYPNFLQLCQHSVQKHPANFKGNLVDSLSCPVCDKLFNTVTAQHTHMAMAHLSGQNMEMFGCRTCRCVFTSRGKCVKHVEEIHQESEVEDKICLITGHNYNNLYSCPVKCGYRTTQSHLVPHSAHVQIFEQGHMASPPPVSRHEAATAEVVNQTTSYGSQDVRLKDPSFKGQRFFTILGSDSVLEAETTTCRLEGEYLLVPKSFLEPGKYTVTSESDEKLKKCLIVTSEVTVPTIDPSMDALIEQKCQSIIQRMMVAQPQGFPSTLSTSSPIRKMDISDSSSSLPGADTLVSAVGGDVLLASPRSTNQLSTAVDEVKLNASSPKG